MNHLESLTSDNIISLESKLKDTSRDQARQPAAEPGSKNDPRMKEALVLIEAFLAIEDQAARKSLVTLAQQLVTYDWARRVIER